MKRLGPTLVALAVATPLIAVTSTAGAAPSGSQRLVLSEIVSGLSTPVDLRAPAGDNRVFIAELPGRIRILEGNTLKQTPFLDIQGRVGTGGERGLLAFAFHPKYEKNGLFYVYYTDNGGDTRISEFEVSPSNPDRARTSSERILLEIDQPASNHNGGGFAFGPDGYLYIASGDGGGGGDPYENGQNPNTLLGSLLRIDVDKKTANREYGIPKANPFKNGGGKKEVYAYGLRNPWRMSIDQATGRIFIGDVGQSRREEVDTLHIHQKKAINFGWDVMEGTLCYEPSSGCDKSGKRKPIVEYQNPEQGVSVIGGYVYRGNAIPWLRGTYFYSDLTGRRLRSFRYENGKVRKKTDWTSQVGLIPASVFGFGQDGFGELYVLAGSRAYRVEAANPTTCDFDGDGDDDLAIGVPGENRNGVKDAGAVQVLESRNGSPGTAGDVLWDQDRKGVAGSAKKKDGWGSALACGDYDGDGFDDLAIGAPAAGTGRGGAVSVLFGSSNGLSTRDQRFRQGKDGIGGASEAGDDFGAALAAGDFDGDGFGDLVIGAPGEALGGDENAGKIHVLYGSSSGLTSSSDRVFHQDTTGIKQTAEKGDRFGKALAAGDFDGDGYTDLAVGVPGETSGGASDTGLVQILYGRRAVGISDQGDDVVHQSRSGVKDTAEAGDEFGAALAAGPVNADGYDDLLVGVPGESIGSAQGAGAAHYFKGSPSGLGVGGDLLLSQDTPGVDGSAQSGDGFASSVAVGDIDGDGFADLVTGVPGENHQGKADTGSVNIIYGRPSGPGGQGQLWHQDSQGVLGAGRAGDVFGSSVALLDLGGGRHLDLIVGVPGKKVGGLAGAGQVAVLFGGSAGVTAGGDMTINQKTAGISGSPGSGDRFGETAAS